KNDIRLQAIGRLEALPPQVRKELDAAVDATANNRGLLVNLAINYGGRAEIVDAVNSILEMARIEGSLDTLRLDEDLIADSVLTALALIPWVVLVVLFADRWIFLAVLTTVACLCYREYDVMAGGYGFGRPGIVGYGAGLWLLLWWDVSWLPIVGLAIAALILV